MTEKVVERYRPIFQCPLCGALAKGDPYTRDEVDHVLEEMSDGRECYIEHFCKDGSIGVMSLWGFVPFRGNLNEIKK